jgi:hypothetical protein
MAHDLLINESFKKLVSRLSAFLVLKTDDRKIYFNRQLLIKKPAGRKQAGLKT